MTRLLVVVSRRSESDLDGQQYWHTYLRIERLSTLGRAHAIDVRATYKTSDETRLFAGVGASAEKPRAMSGGDGMRLTRRIVEHHRAASRVARRRHRLARHLVGIGRRLGWRVLLRRQLCHSNTCCALKNPNSVCVFFFYKNKTRA
jgi:hypothetical protein